MNAFADLPDFEQEVYSQQRKLAGGGRSIFITSDHHAMKSGNLSSELFFLLIVSDVK